MCLWLNISSPRNINIVTRGNPCAKIKQSQVNDIYLVHTQTLNFRILILSFAQELPEKLTKFSHQVEQLIKNERSPTSNFLFYNNTHYMNKTALARHMKYYSLNVYNFLSLQHL